MRHEIKSIDFGQWVKAKRKAAGLNQVDLAKMIPTNKNTLSRWETGDRLPTLDNAERLAEIFGAELVLREKGYDG